MTCENWLLNLVNVGHCWPLEVTEKKGCEDLRQNVVHQKIHKIIQIVIKINICQIGKKINHIGKIIEQRQFLFIANGKKKK
jgi:hypothetical protein